MAKKHISSQIQHVKKNDVHDDKKYKSKTNKKPQHATKKTTQSTKKPSHTTKKHRTQKKVPKYNDDIVDDVNIDEVDDFDPVDDVTHEQEEHDDQEEDEEQGEEEQDDEENQDDDEPVKNKLDKKIRERLKAKIVDWMDSDDKIKILNARTKKYKDNKKQQEDIIIKIISKLGLDDKKIDVHDQDDQFRGRVYRHKSVTKGSLKEDIIKDALMEAIRDEKKVDQLVKKIESKRPINERYYLKRTKGNKDE